MRAAGVLVCLLAYVGGCDAAGDMTGGARDGAADGAPELDGAAQADSAPEPDTASQPQPDGPPSTPDTRVDTRPPDTAPPAQSCPGAGGAGFVAMGCGHIGPPVNGSYTRISRWKDGRECATCRDGSGAARTGCTVSRDEPDPWLCVGACTECCWRTAGEACASDAECCAPLRCTSSGSGGNTTCQ